VRNTDVIALQIQGSIPAVTMIVFLVPDLETACRHNDVTASQEHCCGRTFYSLGLWVPFWLPNQQH